MAGPEVVVVDDSDEEEEVEEPGPPVNLLQEGDTGLEARMLKALREVFRLRAFRPPQQAVVKHVLKGGSGLVLVSCGYCRLGGYTHVLTLDPPVPPST